MVKSAGYGLRLELRCCFACCRVAPYALASLVGCKKLWGGWVQLFYMKLRNRQQEDHAAAKRMSLGGVRVSPEIAHTKSVQELKEKFDTHQMDKQRWLLGPCVYVQPW